jgi:acyl transferase domain-containing protein
LRLFVENNGEVSLKDVAYTLQVGREAMPHRWAAVVNNRGQLLDALETGGEKDSPNFPKEKLFKSFVDPTLLLLDGLLDKPAQEQILQRYIAEKNLAKLAAWWVKGIDVEWEALHDQGSAKRIWLPTYAFGASGNH